VFSAINNGGDSTHYALVQCRAGVATPPLPTLILQTQNIPLPHLHVTSSL
jgi:hypothetical protein